MYKFPSRANNTVFARNFHDDTCKRRISNTTYVAKSFNVEVNLDEVCGYNSQFMWQVWKLNYKSVSMQYDYNKLFLLMKLIKFFFKGLENVQINYFLSEKYHDTGSPGGPWLLLVPVDRLDNDRQKRPVLSQRVGLFLLLKMLKKIGHSRVPTETGLVLQCHYQVIHAV